MYGSKKVVQSQFLGQEISSIKRMLHSVPGIGSKLVKSFLDHHGGKHPAYLLLKKLKKEWKTARSKGDPKEEAKVLEQLKCPNFSEKRLAYILDSIDLERPTLLRQMETHKVPLVHYQDILTKSEYLRIPKERIFALLSCPYQLYLHHLIDLDEADKIARAKGIPTDDPRRIDAHINEFLSFSDSTLYLTSHLPGALQQAGTLGTVSSNSIMARLMHLEERQGSPAAEEPAPAPAAEAAPGEAEEEAEGSKKKKRPVLSMFIDYPITPDPVPQQPIFKFYQNYIYLQRNYENEVRCYEEFKKMAQKPNERLECESIDHDSLTQDQKEVMDNLLNSHLGIVESPIGHGKTFLFSNLLKRLQTIKNMDLNIISGKMSMAANSKTRRPGIQRILIVDDAHLISMDKWLWIFSNTYVDTLTRIYIFGDLSQFNPFSNRTHIFRLLVQLYPNNVYRLTTNGLQLSMLHETAVGLLEKRGLNPSVYPQTKEESVFPNFYETFTAEPEKPPEDPLASQSTEFPPPEPLYTFPPLPKEPEIIPIHPSLLPNYSFKVFYSPTPSHPSHLPYPRNPLNWKETMLFLPSFNNFTEYNKFCQQNWNKNTDIYLAKGEFDKTIAEWKIGDRILWEGSVGNTEIPLGNGLIGYTYC
eukprot:TRINITY_DN4504_c0_g1_i4.p1 TRINITY_DN4504_c0_g1~~TRINITY_DN4504_c0_g1_i4.p1  ORF type:complete len:728 (-),score=211.64 TRINITY_DN4504_c0_g1_i4:1507-3432(-)